MRFMFLQTLADLMVLVVRSLKLDKVCLIEARNHERQIEVAERVQK
jgi:hypothetical protein